MLSAFQCRVACIYPVSCSCAGYVQGMSDLLSPILFVMENEVDAFWCFVSFMDEMVMQCVCYSTSLFSTRVCWVWEDLAASIKHVSVLTLLLLCASTFNGLDCPTKGLLVVVQEKVLVFYNCSCLLQHENFEEQMQGMKTQLIQLSTLLRLLDLAFWNYLGKI